MLNTFIVKGCGRQVCLCQKELWSFRLKLPDKTRINIKQKKYRACYGSYQVMVSNLEKVSELRKSCWNN